MFRAPRIDELRCLGARMAAAKTVAPMPPATNPPTAIPYALLRFSTNRATWVQGAVVASSAHCDVCRGNPAIIVVRSSSALCAESTYAVPAPNPTAPTIPPAMVVATCHAGQFDFDGLSGRIRGDCGDSLGTTAFLGSNSNSRLPT